MTVDLDKYRWNDSATRVEPPKSPAHAKATFEIPRHRSGEHFIRGPIPLDWLQACWPLGLKSANVALALWWLVGVKRSNPVRLTRQVLARFGVTPETSRTVLSKMELSGLVRVDRKRGRGPDVTLLPLCERGTSDESAYPTLGA